MVLDVFSIVAIVAGAFFYLAGTVGLLRFPDAYSQGLLRVPSVRVREEHGTEWHPITRFLHEFSWEAELGHPDAPPTAAQLQAWKRLGQR